MRVSTALRLAALSGALAATGGALWELSSTLASMVSYTAALMALNQIAPPLFLLAAGAMARRAPASSWLYDPLVALTVFGGLSILVSMPQILSRGLANALFSLPIGGLELLSGLLLWAQVMPWTRPIRSDLWLAGYLTLANLPMMVVAVIWMTAGNVLYAPYLNLICLWNLPPLDDQHYAGFVMLAAGFPLQVLALWYLVEGLHAAHRKSAN